MLISTASFASLAVALVGLLILWSNPRRAVNRVVCTCSLHWAVWLWCLHVAAYMHGHFYWVRLTTAVGALFPLHCWVINGVIADNWRTQRKKQNLATLALSVASAILAADCFTDYFIPEVSSRFQRVYGWGYYAYIVGTYLLYGFILYRTFEDSKRLSGGKKVELQVWVFGGCSTAMIIVVAMTLNAITRNRGFIIYQPLLVLGLYAGTAYAITTRRIFDAGQILRVVLNNILLIAGVGGVSYGFFLALVTLVSPAVAVLATIAVALVLAAVLKPWLDRLFRFYSRDTAVRQAAYAIGRSETRIETLEAAYLGLLQGWGQAEHAYILTGEPDRNSAGDQETTLEERVITALRRLGWITPERVIRDRTTPEGELLAEFMTDRRLGVCVFSETPAMSMVVGVGTPATRRPYTYPQITQLQELATIIQGSFERLLLATKIQHAEQLATVGLLGASLAHEIRNPLVSVKAIVQLLPSRYQEAEFRDKFFRLISDEVVRIDRLTEQLLDLASPHVYMARPTELHPVLSTALKLVSPRAIDKRVRIIEDFQATPDLVHTDPAAVTQVLLNLCFNAIQAMDSRPNDRWLQISTRSAPGTVALVVSDNGPGLTSEMRKRLFRPFQTTKSSGFGLGLTICRDILAGLKASITLEPPEPGRGASFRVNFPCQP